MKRRKLTLAVAAIVSTSVVLSACGSTKDTTKSTTEKKNDLSKAALTYIKAEDTSKDPATAKSRKDTMIIGMEAPDPGNLIPYLSNSSYNNYLCEMLYSSLGTIDDTGKPIEGMAKWDVSSDGLTYTFHINDKAKFSDGSQVTADDVLFTFEYLLDGSYKGQLFDPTMTHIKGWEDYNKGKSSTVAGIQVVDSKTVKFTLDEKNATAIYTLAGTMIMPKSHFGKNYKQGNDAAVDALQNDPLGSGAWVLKNKKDQQEYDFTANENYWDGAPKIKNLIVKVTTDDTQIQELKTGGTDFDMPTVTEENVDQIKEAGFLDQDITPTWGYGQLMMNEKNPMFSDKKVRQAIAYALDRQNIVKTVYGKYASVIDQPLPMVSWGYNSDVKKYNYDINKAAKLLDEAGWKKGSDGIRAKDGKRFEIHYLQSTPNSVNDTLIPIAKDAFKKLGIIFNPEPMQFASMNQKVAAKDYEMAFEGAALSAADPDQGASFKTNGTQNYENYSNPEVDKLYDQGLAELDQSKRATIYKKIGSILNEDLPVIPVYERSDMNVINARITGMKPTTFKDFTYFLPKAEIK